MIDFAVQVKGEKIGYWVLAVDAAGERFLIGAPDKSFRWVSMADCLFLKMVSPEHPKPVFVMPTQAPPPGLLDLAPYGKGRSLRGGNNG